MTEEELLKLKIGFISLGCDKNRVDLENMMFKIRSAGFSIVDDLNEANIILINTCAFIQPAREEAIDTILEIAKNKNNGILQKIIVTGCLPEKHFNEVKDAMPEIDALLKLKDNDSIVVVIYNLFHISSKKIKHQQGRILTTPSHYAYLKISDGCSNCCAYCTIPRIRGRYISRPYNDIIKEAKSLADQGVKELIIVAQDITRYGYDLENKSLLCSLLSDISKIKQIKWIRLHYLYPEMIDDDLIKLISSNDKICSYVDIPLQHLSDNILSAMNRRSNSQQIFELIKRLKSSQNKIAIRSTFIVGFPGETKRDYKQLCNGLKELKLDNVGFFMFYREEGTRACYMDKQIRSFTKKSRLKHIQKLQEKISVQNNMNRIGESVEVLIDVFDPETGNYIGRDQYNSPNVDYCVIIQPSKDIQIGNFYKVKLVDFKNYYFKGELL